MTMEIYSSISYGNVYMYTGTFSDKLINASFADAVASEMFFTSLVLCDAFEFWLYLQMRPEVTEVTNEKELSYAVLCQYSTRKLCSNSFFR